MKSILSVLVVIFFAGCSLVEDPATSIAFEIERGVGHLGSEDGASYVIVHDAKSRAGADARTIKVQFDKVGALIVWYMDADGKILKSGSTSYLSRFVDIPETIIVDNPIDSPLNIEVQRRKGRTIVVRVF